MALVLTLKRGDKVRVGSLGTVTREHGGGVSFSGFASRALVFHGDGKDVDVFNGGDGFVGTIRVRGRRVYFVGFGSTRIVRAGLEPIP